MSGKEKTDTPSVGSYGGDLPDTKLHPVFFRMDRMPVLIVGGGVTAGEKIHFLLKNTPCAQITVVAKEISSAVYEHAQKNRLNILKATYAPQHLDQCRLVIAATQDLKLNKLIAGDAAARNIPCNVCDNPELSDFYLCGVVSKGPLKLGISTGGLSPLLASAVRRFFEDTIPDDLPMLVREMGRMRKVIRQRIRSHSEATNEIIENWK